MLTIVDYGIGNLGSILNMLKKIGVPAVLGNDEASIARATRIILPGIGHFDHCMREFNASGLRESIARRVFSEKIPLLGICVGLQMLMESSEEGTEPGLGWIEGKTIRFDTSKTGSLKIPHMGWTEVVAARDSPLTRDLGDHPRFYFVHAYHVQPVRREDVLLEARYGYEFVAAVSRENVAGVQFHPEKSHRYGMKILANFSGS